MTLLGTNVKVDVRTAGLWRLARNNRVVQIALALIVMQLAYRAWATYGAWYTGDDFFFISRMLNDGLSPEIAAQQYAGHIMPAPMYLSWLFNAMAPFDWRPTATFLLLMQAMASLGLLRLLLTMFGPRLGILPPIALHLFSVFSVPISIWWAAGANQLPLQIALFWGLTCHVRYLRSRRIRDAVLAAAWIVGGLLFYEKIILVLGAYAIVTLCYFASGSLVHRLKHVWAIYRAAILMYVAIGVVYLAIYVKVGLTFSPTRAGEFPVAPVAGNMVLRDWVTGIFGGPLRWAAFGKPSAIADPSDLVVGLCIVLFVLLVREVRRTRSRSMRAFVLPGFFLASDILLVLAARASFVGPLIALDYRYQGESGAVAAIGLACATMPILGAVETVQRKEKSELFDVPRRVAVTCAVTSLLGLVSATQHVSPWNADTRTERYFGALIADVRALKSQTPMIDETVPDHVMWAAGYPLNTQSHLLRQFSSHVRFVKVSTDQLQMVATSGHISPVVIPPVRTAVPVTGKKRKQCPFRVDNDGVSIPLTGPLLYGGWWVRIGYLSSGGSPVDVSAGGKSYRTTIRPGVHSLYFETGPDQFDSVTISGLQGDATLCTDDVTVGRPEPAKAVQP